MDKKAQFLRIYANLPQPSRDEIVAVIDGEAYTWRSAKLEIEQETDLAKKILDFLSSLKIL
jgi:hypothetical protein